MLIAFIVMGRLNAEDRSLICNLRTSKGWGSTWMIKEFPNKMWKSRAVDYLVKKIDLDGTKGEEAGQRTSKMCSNHRKRRDRKRADLWSGRHTAVT